MLCAKYLAVKPTCSGEDVKPLPCKTWDCEYCRPTRKRQLIARAAAGRPNKMLTLTVNINEGNSPEHRRELLHNAWIVLKKRMARKLKVKSIQYMAFIERTQQGEPHLHILLRCGYIHFKWYRQQMRELLNSPIIWIEAIKNTRSAIYYVTKYCGKAPAQFGTAKRYWASQQFAPNDPNIKEIYRAVLLGAEVIKREYSELLRTYAKEGWKWHEMSDGWIAFQRPEHHQFRDGYWFPNYKSPKYKPPDTPF